MMSKQINICDGTKDNQHERIIHFEKECPLCAAIQNAKHDIELTCDCGCNKPIKINDKIVSKECYDKLVLQVRETVSTFNDIIFQSQNVTKEFFHLTNVEGFKQDGK